MPTQACVDDEGCSGSGAPAISPSVEKETALRQVSENHTSRVRNEEIGEEEIDSSARKLLSRRWNRQHLSAVAMNVLTNGHNSEQVSKRIHCAGSLQLEITTESPLLPWLVRQCDVAGEVGQKRTAPDLVLWSDELGGLLEPAQEERKECSNWSKSSGEGHARALTHVVRLLRASQSRRRSSAQTTIPRVLSTCRRCKEEASPLQKYGSSRSKQRALHESCRTFTKQVLCEEPICKRSGSSGTRMTTRVTSRSQTQWQR